MGQIQEMLIGALLVCALLIGGTQFFSGMATSYTITDTQNMSNLSSVNKITTMTATMKNQTQNAQITGISLIDIPLTVVNGAANSVMLLFQTIDVTQALVKDIAIITGIPEWFYTIVMAIIVVIVLFAIITALTRAPGGL